MSEITSSQYWGEVSSLAASIVEQAAQDNDLDTAETFDRDQIMEYVNDTYLHETIDGHQWVIYYAYNLDVLKHSDNQDYMIDNLGTESAGESLKQGLDTLHCHLAFWALYADVQDHLDSALDEYENSLESEEE